MGLALSHRAGALGTLLPAARTPPQKAHRLGPPDDRATAPLAAPPPRGTGGRLWLRRPGPAPLPPIVGSTRYPHRPLAHKGRRPGASAIPSDGPERSASAARPTAARAEGAPGLARRVMDRGVGSLVRRRHPHGGTHVANGGLAPLGQAACAPALGPGSGPTGRIHSPSLALHRSVGGPGADPGMVCAALATGGRLSGGAGSPGRGDPTPVAGPSHCPYYANPDRALLLDHPGGPSSVATTTLGPSHRGLARQAVAGLRDAIALVRRHLWLASEGFSLSAAEPDIQELPVALYHRLVDSLAYAA